MSRIELDDLRAWLEEDYIALWEIVVATSPDPQHWVPDVDAVLEILEPLVRDGTLRLGRRDIGPDPFNPIEGLSVDAQIDLIRSTVPLASEPGTDLWIDLVDDPSRGVEPDLPG